MHSCSLMRCKIFDPVVLKHKGTLEDTDNRCHALMQLFLGLFSPIFSTSCISKPNGKMKREIFMLNFC